jgi:hypothetical protein
MGLFIGGHAVFGVCIFVSNQIVFHRSYIHQAYGIAFISLMVGSFFVILYIQSNWGSVTQFADVYGIFSPLLGSPLVWLTIVLACGGVSLGELLLRDKQDSE